MYKLFKMICYLCVCVSLCVHVCVPVNVYVCMCMCVCVQVHMESLKGYLRRKECGSERQLLAISSHHHVFEVSTIIISFNN